MSLANPSDRNEIQWDSLAPPRRPTGPHFCLGKLKIRYMLVGVVTFVPITCLVDDLLKSNKNKLCWLKTKTYILKTISLSRFGELRMLRPIRWRWTLTMTNFYGIIQKKCLPHKTVFMTQNISENLLHKNKLLLLLLLILLILLLMLLYSKTLRNALFLVCITVRNLNRLIWG